MSNPLYNLYGATNNNLVKQFNQFRQSFRGDPQQQVQQLLNSGRVSQQQYNQAVQQANALRKILGI